MLNIKDVKQANRYRFDSSGHVHTLDNKPLNGTSSISGIMPKQLTWWASGKALELMGWTPTKSPKKVRLQACISAFDRIKELTYETYQQLLDKSYRNHKDSLDKSADKGIDLHAELESYVKARIMGLDCPRTAYNERIHPFIDWAEKEVKRFIWSEGYCYSETYWIGGICDCGAELNDGKIVIIDFKSHKEAYLSDFIQCAGYDIQIQENGILNQDGSLVDKNKYKADAYIVFPFGASTIEPYFNTLKIEDYKEGFKHALGIYKLISLDKRSDNE